MLPKVSIIVLNYNGRPHTVECLKSLLKTTYKNKEIILFNNGSSDDTAVVVRSKFPKVKLIEQKENIGFCRGNNKAFTYATGELVLFLNNDTVVTPSFIEPLVERLKRPEIGIVQPKIVFLKSNKLQSGCTFFTNTGFLYYYGYGKDPHEKKYNRARTMYAANGACFMAKREVIERVGLFDEEFFSYFEETDFCHRVLLSGYEIWYEPKSTVYHIGSVDNSQEKHSRLIYNSFRNRICSYLKNCGKSTLTQILPVHLTMSLLAFFVYLTTGRFNHAMSVLNALLDNLRWFSQTRQKRLVVQNKYRKLKDADFLPKVTVLPRMEYYFKLFGDLGTYRD